MLSLIFWLRFRSSSNSSSLFISSWVFSKGFSSLFDAIFIIAPIRKKLTHISTLYWSPDFLFYIVKKIHLYQLWDVKFHVNQQFSNRKSIFLYICYSVISTRKIFLTFLLYTHIITWIIASYMHCDFLIDCFYSFIVIIFCLRINHFDI